MLSTTWCYLPALPFCACRNLNHWRCYSFAWSWRMLCPQCSAPWAWKYVLSAVLWSAWGSALWLWLWTFNRKVQIPEIYTVSADSMSKRAKRASELHKQIVSRMCVASLRASETYAQALLKQADSRKRMASSEPIGATKCVCKQCNMYISFCSKAWPIFCAPVTVIMY